jgi:hypothetical protein
MAAPSASCTRHVLREAVGVCVRCTETLCAECITKIDGINHCQPCLSRLAQGTPARPSARSRPAPDSLVIAASFCLVSALMWLMIEVAMPGPGWP